MPTGAVKMAHQVMFTGVRSHFVQMQLTSLEIVINHFVASYIYLERAAALMHCEAWQAYWFGKKIEFAQLCQDPALNRLQVTIPFKAKLR